MKRRMSTLSEKDIQHLKHMTEKAKLANIKDPDYKALRKRCENAKRRCTNVNCPQYADYGGRGIKFAFESAVSMADWIIANIGYPPSPAHSLARIDNNRHYERGNLRWATRAEQNSNKRAYKIGTCGARIQRLITKTSFGYESIRSFIKQGLTDEEIINKRKTKAGRPRTSASLRPCKRGQKEQILGER